MKPTFNRVYRERDRGPILVDTTGGVVHWRFLSDASKFQLCSLVNKQSDWESLEQCESPWSLTLNGEDKPEWNYEGAPDSDQEFEADYPSDGEGEAEAEGKPDSGELPGMPEQNPEQGEGEGEGEGEGGGDDKPVMWSELTPWAEKVVKAFDQVSQETETLRAWTDAAQVNAIEVSKKLSKLQNAVEKLHKNGVPEGGGGIIKIEITTPREVKMGEGLFHAQFPLLLKLVSSGMHVYLPGPPGGGKSHSAEQIAGLLGWKFGSLSLGPTTPESRLWGGKDANGHFHEPAFIELARFAQDTPDSGAVYCLDEMDNGHPGILATLNSAMANGWFTTPRGDTVRIGSNFVLVGAANTYGTGPTAEFSGRNRLDAATLDRFAYVPWDTDTKMESALVRAFLAETENGSAMAGEWLDVWRTCRKNVATNNLRVFVTMRGAINGAKLLAGGLDVDTVLGVVLLNKLPADQRAKIDPL